MTRISYWLFRGAVCWCVCLASSIAYGLDAENVLVLYNQASPDGAAIAAAYQQAHPGAQSLELTGVPLSEQISAGVYLDVIRPQVLGALTDDVDCIVTTTGLPLRISNAGDGAGWSRYSSLESELARVDTIDSSALMGNQNWMLPDIWGGNSLTLNPYFREDGAFSYAEYGVRLTSRLDGFTVEDVTASIQRAGRAVVDRPGMTFLIDDDPTAPATNADRMDNLAAELADRGRTYVHDTTEDFISEDDDRVLGYVSHGVYGGGTRADPPDQPSYVLEDLDFPFAPGAVFASYESYNAYSFREGQNRAGQALLAEWIAAGGTAAVGHVEEPGASAPNITDEAEMFRRLLDGQTWAEAAWGATMQMSFVNTVVGDPLMRWRPWLTGDFNQNGILDAEDIDALAAVVQAGSADPAFDLDGDGEVTSSDLNFMVLELLGTRYGDVNLDGRIDGLDLSIMAGNWHETSAGVAQGDWNFDGRVGIEDISLLAQNWGWARELPTGQDVPEPVTLLLTAVGAGTLLRRR